LTSELFESLYRDRYARDIDAILVRMTDDIK
jgi:hypothetical protein